MKPFVAPAEILAEVRRIRDDRINSGPIPTPDTDDLAEYIRQAEGQPQTRRPDRHRGGAMTGRGDRVTDPEIQAAIDRAIELLARRLAAVAPLADPEAAAKSFIDELVDGPDRWRPIPPEPDWHDPRPTAPAL